MIRDSKQVLTELLVLKAQGGCERSFTDLYELWTKDLLRLAKVQLEKTLDAEEVTQEAWIAISKGLRRLDDPAAFPRWAFRILDRRCVDWIRKQQTNRRRIVAVANEQDRNQSEGSAVAQSAETVALAEVIKRLDSDARKLLHLFYETGFSVAEIAEVFGVPVGTVKSRLFKTREKLKRYMESENNE